jgi:hypothetical protein
MAEPTVTDDVPQSVRDAHEKFDAGMGAQGDASPYPMLAELRAKGAVHPGWPEMGILDNTGDGPPIYTAYTFDAVKEVFTDNTAFSWTRMRPSPTSPACTSAHLHASMSCGTELRS